MQSDHRIDRLARRLLQVERDVKNVGTQPRLSHSSIDGGALEIRDTTTGETTAVIGQQFDGTTSTAVVGGTFPVAPTMPLVTEIVGGLRIYWDGTYDDGSPTRMDFKRVTLHAVTDVDDFDALDAAQIVGEISIATGGEVTVGLPYVEHFVCAVVWTESGKFSVPSDFDFGTPQKASPSDVTTDGDAPVPPGGWAAVLEPLGVMALQAEWPEVPNADAVTYDVYLSTTSGFTTFDSTTFVGSTAGTFIAIRALPNGDPFLPDTTYYARVIARDGDGDSAPSIQGSAFVRQADVDSISPGWVYTGGVEAGQILTGELQASLAVVGEISTSGSGRKVSISSADGFKAADPDGVVVAHIPTELTQDISLQADVVAKSVTALGSVAMRAANNEIAQAAALIMRSATAAPVSPPTVSIEWNTIERPSRVDGAPNFRGGNYHAATNRFYQAWAVWGYSGIHWYNATTGALVDEITVGNPGIPGAAANTFSAVRYGDVIYCHVQRAANPTWYLRRYDAITKLQIGSDIALGSDTMFDEGVPCLTVNTAGELVLAYFNSGTLWRATYNRDTGVQGSNVNTGFAAPVSGLNNIVGMYEGPGEVGGDDRMWFTVEGTSFVYNIKPYTGGMPRDTDREFYTAYGVDSGLLAYDTTRGAFVTSSRSDGSLHIYDGTNWTTESGTWYVTNTWRDTDTTGGTHQTSQGPAASIAMKRRARISVTTPPIPSDPDNGNHDDPNAVAIYVGRGDGSVATQWRQATPADGVRTATIQTVIFSNADTLHPNPPSIGDFPNLTPAVIKSDASDGNGPLFWVDGSGAGRWTLIDGTDAGVTYEANVADVFEGSRAYKRGKMGHIAYGFSLTANKAAGATLFTVPVGYRPLRTTRSVGWIVGGSFVTLTMLTSGVVYSEVALSSGQSFVGNFGGFPL